MMPRDTNQYGTIFGGVLLSYIDLAGGIGAEHEMRCNGWPERALVTVAMDRVEFREPVMVGDVLSLWTTVQRIGTTSITMHVAVESEQQGGQPVLVTAAACTYVAVELQDGRRHTVPIRGGR